MNKSEQGSNNDDMVIGSRIPKDATNDYSDEIINQRISWLEKKTNTKIKHLKNFSENPANMQGNIENLIGVAQVPIGITGPIKVNGEYANGDFYVPMATTEGVLITSYNVGMRVLSKSGGVSTCILNDEIHITPIFYIDNIKQRKDFVDRIENDFKRIKAEAETTTRFGKLHRIEPKLCGRGVLLRFCFTTGDAMGLNMINIAVDKACQYIKERTGFSYSLRSGYSSDKKPSSLNHIKGYGKEVFAEAVIERKSLRLLNVDPEDLLDWYHTTALTGYLSGMFGMNGQMANAIAAIYIACGQDVAHVVNSSIGVSMCEINKNGDLYVSVYIPNLLVGTVGGGTSLGTQRECLQIMGCYGDGKAKKFAEIVAATVLAGELSISASLKNGTFVEAHKTISRRKVNR